MSSDWHPGSTQSRSKRFRPSTHREHILQTVNDHFHPSYPVDSRPSSSGFPAGSLRSEYVNGPLLGNADREYLGEYTTTYRGSVVDNDFRSLPNSHAAVFPEYRHPNPPSINHTHGVARPYDTAMPDGEQLRDLTFPAPSRPSNQYTRASLFPTEPLISRDSYASQVHSSSPPLRERSSPTMSLAMRRQPSLYSPRAVEIPATAPLALSGPLDHAHRPPAIHGLRLISPRESIPDKFRNVFPYELFNYVQTKCFPSIYESNDNVVVAAPTGSGKTVVLELAICKLAVERGSQNFKIVYQAPTKALCSERARDWEKKFRIAGLQVAELTGDSSPAEVKRVATASIIVTTPEKWDSVTRKWTDHRKLVEMVELFLIDEVHMLRESRGATLEAVVSRMKTIGANVRFVALSATVPNSEDIAKWLGRDHTTPELPARREIFGEEVRPVKLTKFVYGYEVNGNDHVFDKYLDQKLPGVLFKHSQKKPMLVFCFTKNSCESTARLLGDAWAAAAPQNKPWRAPPARVAVVNAALQEVVRYGVAFHHGGLDPQDRASIEQNYLDGNISVICCTGTLALGVNLPCHTVVLKGTVTYQDGGKLQECSDLEVMQMLGRAGRPQFEDSATAIIFTRKHNAQKYEQMVSGEQVIESTLHQNLIEHLNSEVVLRAVQSIESAKRWLAGSFLAVRLRRNPAYYRLTESMSNTQLIDDRLEEICERDISQLQETKLISDGTTFTATEYGRAMSSYMVRFETMKLILGIPKVVTLEQLIATISQAAEFKELRIKPQERPIFRELNKDPFIRFPIKEAVAQTWHKISLLIQIELGGVELPNNGTRRQINLETTTVLDCAQRLVRCFTDCREADCDAIGTNVGLELSRSLAAKSWEGMPTQLLQVTGIGPVGMRKLVQHDVRTVLQLAEVSYADIERMLSRNPPFGKKMADSLEKFPRLTLEANIVRYDKPHGALRDVVTLTVKATLGYVSRKGVPNWKSKMPWLTFVAETAGGILVHFWRGSFRAFRDSRHELTFSVSLANAEDVTCHFSCDEIVGTIVSKRLRYRGPELRKGVTPARDSINYQEEDFSDAEASLFPSVDELVGTTSQYLATDKEAASAQDGQEPVRLPNGKWQCNHACSGSGSTKAGKTCTHRCCREGVEKPRKPTVKKRKPDGEEEDRVAGLPPSVPGSTTNKDRALDPGPKTQTQKRIDTSFQPVAKKPRLRNRDVDFDDSEIEFIDLSTIDDDDPAPQPGARRGQQSKGQGQKGTSTVDKSRHLPQPGGAGTAPDEFSGEDIFDDFPTIDALASVLDDRTRGAFKPEASDEVLFDGIGSGFSDNSAAEEAIFQAAQLLDMEPSSGDYEDGPQRGGGGLELPSGALLDQWDGATLVGANASHQALSSLPLLLGTAEEEQDPGHCSEVTDAKTGKEPTWVQEVDPELANFFRGYVTFVD